MHPLLQRAPLLLFMSACEPVSGRRSIKYEQTYYMKNYGKTTTSLQVKSPLQIR